LQNWFKERFGTQFVSIINGGKINHPAGRHSWDFNKTPTIDQIWGTRGNKLRIVGNKDIGLFGFVTSKGWKGTPIPVGGLEWQEALHDLEFLYRDDIAEQIISVLTSRWYEAQAPKYYVLPVCPVCDESKHLTHSPNELVVACSHFGPSGQLVGCWKGQASELNYGFWKQPNEFINGNVARYYPTAEELRTVQFEGLVKEAAQIKADDALKLELWEFILSNVDESASLPSTHQLYACNSPIERFVLYKGMAPFLMHGNLICYVHPGDKRSLFRAIPKFDNQAYLNPGEAWKLENLKAWAKSYGWIDPNKTWRDQ
jgi:hypothetical protein